MQILQKTKVYLILEDGSTVLYSNWPKDYRGEPVSMELCYWNGAEVCQKTEEIRAAEKRKEITEKISALSVQRNYELLPQYKRDNIYAGDPACDGYPDYLKGEAGKQTIAKMNAYFRQRTKQAIQELETKNLYELVFDDPFPKTAEEMLLILQS